MQRIVIWKMKYLNSLLIASFFLLATLHLVQATTMECRAVPTVVAVDYSTGFDENHLAFNNTGKWTESCGIVEPKVSLTKHFRDKIVKLHNIYRNTISKGQLPRVPIAARMFKLHWDTNLATIADFILKRCTLDNLGKDLGVPNAKDPGINAAYSMFPIHEDQDPTKIMESHLNMWYNQYQHITYRELSTDHSPPGQETSHFKQLAVGLNSRIGCAVGRYSREDWMYQMTICVYGCKKLVGHKPYAVGKIPGEDCGCGVCYEFKYLCNGFEHLEDCGNCLPDSTSICRTADEEGGEDTKSLKPGTRSRHWRGYSV